MFVYWAKPREAIEILLENFSMSLPDQRLGKNLSVAFSIGQKLVLVSLLDCLVHS